MTPRRTARAMGGLEVEAAARFRSELRRFLRATETVTSSEGLTPERYDLLLMIHAAQLSGRSVTVNTLRDALQLPQQGVTELVKRAVQAGLVVRERSLDDRRVSFLKATPDGEQRLQRAFLALRSDRVALAEAFERLAASFGDLASAGQSGRRGRSASA